MTTLEKSYQILHLDNKKTEWTGTKPKAPEHSFSFNPFNIPQNRQQIKVKEYLSKALAFIDMVKYIRLSDKEGGFTVLNIATTNKRLLSMFNKSQPRVSLWIEYLIKIGLIAEYDETYRFNAFDERKNKSKSYVYSYDTESKIKEYCEINNINKYVIKNNSSNIYNSIKLQNKIKKATS